MTILLSSTDHHHHQDHHRFISTPIPRENLMELPEEIFGEILDHLRKGSTSFRDLRVAFTCKALYREFGPLIKERQTSLLLGALDKRSITIWARDDEADNFRKFLQQGVGQEVTFFGDGILRDLGLHVRSSADADLVWSLHAHLVKHKGLGVTIFYRLRLTLESTKSTIKWSPTEPLSEYLQRDAAATLVYWGDEKDQAHLARALGAFSLLAMELVEGDMDIRANLRARLPETPMLLPQLEASDPTAGLSNMKLPILKLASVPCPGIFPFPHVDAVLRASSMSLKELKLSGTLRSTPSAEKWGTVLDRCTFTQLTRITIREVATPIPALISFLQRSPTITVVKLVPAKTDTHTPGITILKPLKCSYIRELTANPEILLPLLHGMSVAFPTLETLRISQDTFREKPISPDFEYCRLDDLTTILSCIPASAPSLHTLSLDLLYPGELLEWLGSITAPVPPVDEQAQTNVDGVKPLLVKVLGRLHQITHLQFSVSEDSDRNDQIGFSKGPPYIYVKPRPVIDFVAAFPALKTARLMGLFYRFVKDDERSDYGDFWPEVSEIWRKAGSALEKVVITDIGHGFEQETAVWVRGEEEPEGGFAAFPLGPVSTTI